MPVKKEILKIMGGTVIVYIVLLSILAIILFIIPTILL